ncbi:MAG TPA: ATP-binding cassette domain-containing protein [Polyangiaceae bacterium]|nr:ATP-binding cassette domain-containing protein [Polyangiaceae bacterium]
MSSDVLSVELRLSAGAFELDVAFEVPPGITVLFGPSGSGKSSTLAAIAGLAKPARGRVALGDATWFDAARGIDVPPESRGLSLVFQTLALFPHLTAQDNVEYGMDRALPRRERRDRARAMLERMRIGHVAGRLPRTFSGGEAQRVALARAFARSPRVVLLDEAFSALDRDLRYALGADVRELVAERSIPTIVVTHHRHEARTLADRAIALRDGRVEAQGAVRDVVPAADREQ